MMHTSPQLPAAAMDPATDSDDILRRAARVDPNAFMGYVFRDEERGLPIIQAPHHTRWQDLVSDNDRVIIWSAVEHGKSFQLTVGRVLWELGSDSSMRIAIVSNTYEQSQKFLRVIAKYIESSPELHAVFPDLAPGDVWSGGQLIVKRGTTSKDPSVQSFGVHGAVLGSRIDRLVLDDILDYENCRTEASRKELDDWYHASLAGRLTARAKVWVIGTSWHPDDLLHKLAAQGGWRIISTPSLTESGEPAWPERWPLARIEAKRLELGPLEFARQMMCQARDDADSRFRREWIDRCLELGRGLMLSPGLDIIPPGYRTYTGVDLAVSRKTAADKTCLFTLGIGAKQQRQVLNIETGRWAGPEIVARVADTHRRYGSIIYVEGNAAQDFIRQFTTDQTAVPVKSFVTSAKNKWNPEFGVESIAAEMAAGKWTIPSGDGKNLHPEVAAWVTEMLYYDPAGHTGDRLMASWIAREAARLGTRVVSSGRLDLMAR
jgi:hypothetical protein